MNFEAFIAQCEQDCAARFSQIDAQSLRGTRRVLDAFAQHHIGRDTLEAVVAELFGASSAIVRPQIASGTHALSMCLFGLLKPGDHLLAGSGMPYDTLAGVIGQDGKPEGSLSEMGVSFDAVPQHYGRSPPAQPRLCLA